MKEFKEKEKRLDILVNNGGVMRCPRMLTKQGIEMQLGVNHMGHFLLTCLLVDHLKVNYSFEVESLIALNFFSFYIPLV